MARNELSMKQKVELILQSEGKSQRQLAELFNIGKTQVQTILKRKAEILEAYEGNRDTARKRLCVRMEHGYLNLIMCRWFQHVQSQGIPVNGPIIQKAALHFAKELGIKDFKASNGWLRSFRSRNNISFETFCDESPGVNQAWKFQAKLSGHTSYSPVVLPSSSPNAGPTLWVVSGNEARPVPASAAVASDARSTTTAPSNPQNTRMESHSPLKAVPTPASSNCQREPNDYHKNILQQTKQPTSQEAYQITALQELLKQIKQETEALQKEQETVRQKLGAQTFHITLFGQPSPTQPEVASTPSIAKWAVTRKEIAPVTGNNPTTAAPGASNSAFTGRGKASPNHLVSSERAPTSNMNPNLLSKPKNQSLKGLKVDDAAQVLSTRAVATTGVSNGQGEIKMTNSSGVGCMEEHERMVPQEKHKQERLEVDIDLSRVKSEVEDRSSAGFVHDDESFPSGPFQQPFNAEPKVLPFCIKIVKEDPTDFDDERDPHAGCLFQQEQTQPLLKPSFKHNDLHSPPLDKLATPDNSQLEILKTLLKLTTKERDSYKTQNDTLLRRIQDLEKQLLELTQKNIKKDLCHNWTQSDFELISNNAATPDEIC
ncbi:MORC family CW-type zinc finger protein 3-like [Heptranchias perlo]|uniref:MORC family CW-type zinc finger protein 3-like n=1 Tax=Heptranchias perlo TaxID=212740 RepID=UPI00355AA3F8